VNVSSVPATSKPSALAPSPNREGRGRSIATPR
jgi:hypothetical protein